MAERNVLLQYVINQRSEPPRGLRIWSDGTVQRPADDNALPTATEPLEKDRLLNWIDTQVLTGEQIETIRAAIRLSGIFDLPPRLLINYCKEDPGTAIWTVNLDGQSARVVVYDPRPRRSAEIDQLNQAINAVLTP
jgi:hypothetical protein